MHTQYSIPLEHFCTEQKVMKISNKYLILWNNVIGEVDQTAKLWRQNTEK